MMTTTLPGCWHCNIMRIDFSFFSDNILRLLAENCQKLNEIDDVMVLGFFSLSGTYLPRKQSLFVGRGDISLNTLFTARMKGELLSTLCNLHIQLVHHLTNHSSLTLLCNLTISDEDNSCQSHHCVIISSLLSFQATWTQILSPASYFWTSKFFILPKAETINLEPVQNSALIKIQLIDLYCLNELC